MKFKLFYCALIFGFLFTSCAKEELSNETLTESTSSQEIENRDSDLVPCNQCFQLYSLCITGNSDCDVWPAAAPYITIKELCANGHVNFIADVPVSSGQNCMAIYLPAKTVTTFRLENAGDCKVQVAISTVGCENFPSAGQGTVNFNLTRQNKAKARNMPQHCDFRCLDENGVYFPG